MRFVTRLIRKATLQIARIVRPPLSRSALALRPLRPILVHCSTAPRRTDSPTLLTMTTDRAHRAAAATTTALKRLCTPRLGLTLLTLLAALAALAALHDHGGSVRTTLDRGETEARRSRTRQSRLDVPSTARTTRPPLLRIAEVLRPRAAASVSSTIPLWRDEWFWVVLGVILAAMSAVATAVADVKCRCASRRRAAPHSMHRVISPRLARWLALSLLLVGARAGCVITPDANGHVDYPAGETSMGSNAFYQCTSLRTITLPDSLTSIGTSAFYYCTSLTSVTFGSGLTSIGQYAFRYCSSLASITLP